MLVVNNEKERQKTYLRSNIQSCITNVTAESNKIHDTISALQNAVGGAPSGADGRLIGLCQQALQQISVALQNLNQSQQYVNEIDTREEIPDEQYR